MVQHLLACAVDYPQGESFIIFYQGVFLTYTTGELGHDFHSQERRIHLRSLKIITGGHE